MMAGAYKATAAEALEVELEVEPPNLYTAKTALTEAHRLNQASTSEW